MKLRLIDFLVSPVSKTPLHLNISKQELKPLSQDDRKLLIKYRSKSSFPREDLNDEAFINLFETHIIEGSLTCNITGNVYPVTHGIPVLLPPELRTTRGAMGRNDPLSDERLSEFLDEAKVISKNDPKRFEMVQKANQSNYGYEWKAFSHEHAAWKDVYKRYYVLEDDPFFDGKIGLDAGCGMGRYPLVAASNGAEMVGIDLSNAIEASYEKSLSNPLFHAVQGDIFNLPFRDESFDFAESLGVIHITPDPEAALQSIKSKVKQSGKIWIYVYPSFKDENKIRYYGLKFVNLFRRFTIKLPSNVLYVLLWILAPFIWLFLLMPSRILNFFGFRKLSLILPYNHEQYRNRGMRDIHMNLFDRFGNPAERRYDRSEMQEWMSKAGFNSFELFFRDGWTVSAIK